MTDKSAVHLPKGFPPDTIRSRDNYRRNGHGFTTGQVVAYNGTTLEWELSEWNLTGTSEALGVIDSTDTYKFDVVYRGVIDLPLSLAVTGPVGTIQPSTVYFLSATPGVLTPTPPEFSTTVDRVRKPMIVTLNEVNGVMQALVVNYRGYVEETEGCVAFVKNLIPIGTIDAVPGSETDIESQQMDGWLLCDGSSLPFIDENGEPTEYNELFRVIGFTYGGSGNTFKLPDFRQDQIIVGTDATLYGITGSDDLNLTLQASGEIQVGDGYSDTIPSGNKQPVYYVNLFIRYKDVEKYINIDSCNGAGGAVRNWIVNGGFDVWQRGTSFDPNGTLTGTQHLADLNRYTADKWFRKVGYCPADFSDVAPNTYVGGCARREFSKTQYTIPNYPANYMEYQSFISGPHEDNALEYCVLEHRIGRVQTLAGERVCLSFWMRADTSGYVYLNLKQHFGYDVLTAQGVKALYRPDLQEENSNAGANFFGGADTPILGSLYTNVASNPLSGIKTATYTDSSFKEETGITEWTYQNKSKTVIESNRIAPKSLMIPGESPDLPPLDAVVANSSVLVDLSDSTPISDSNTYVVGVRCTCNCSCDPCQSTVTSVSVANTVTFTNTIAEPCNTTPAQASRSLEVSSLNYSLIRQGLVPDSVRTNAYNICLAFAAESQDICVCGDGGNGGNGPDGPEFNCSSFIPGSKGAQYPQAIGQCCVPTIASAGDGREYIDYSRVTGTSVENCIALGGQFFDDEAVEYFSQYGETECGVSEDTCSGYIKLAVGTSWQQYELIFDVPSVQHKYIGNSGSDYLGIQLWTHLKNGYCIQASGGITPPRNRLGETFGTTACYENSLCEPCVSAYPAEFTFTGTLNLAQFQLQRGTEFTGWVQTNPVEQLDHCQFFYEASTCSAEGGYTPVAISGGLYQEVDFKKQKRVVPKVVVTQINTATNVGTVDVDELTVTQKGFSMNADTLGAGSFVSRVSYASDADLYRAEEVAYLDIQFNLTDATAS